MNGMAEETLRNKVLDLMKTCDEIGSHTPTDSESKDKVADHVMDVIKTTMLGTSKQNHMALIAFITSIVYSSYSSEILILKMSKEIEELKKK